ncbi:4'-phosphopantetheinyl transferase superfamily protein [Gilliamella sp. Pra-s54]|uniref:4'-phosphopantetheinyl transferase superfamily protein n=1 Tax=Gilliamella sp. Pra-s54 TaxID=2687314 RepID=UPI001320DE0C|nr:4'-phosphopantetheinyl transferase superfamily protein [Gilliamella sp. Pra-s54]MWN32773.1 4'-phosphopantetheinyl transferase superfamily protein [Gilliamella sp. Pra-s60]MWP30193.1 4'-phosphopantetheinyl transferase superfamily protein [Gilliamella sp. Pra-s54]
MLTVTQESWILKRKELSECQSTTLIFSAKESIFKAVFNQTNGNIHLKSSALTDLDNVYNILLFKIDPELVKKYKLPSLIKVNYLFCPPFVRTGVIIRSEKSKK